VSGKVSSEFFINSDDAATRIHKWSPTVAVCMSIVDWYTDVMNYFIYDFFKIGNELLVSLRRHYGIVL